MEIGLGDKREIVIARQCESQSSQHSLGSKERSLSRETVLQSSSQLVLMLVRQSSITGSAHLLVLDG